jgi:putative transposase
MKSVNQYYNKTKAKLQSKLENDKRTSKRIEKLTLKRNNKINDYLHKASRYIVNQLVSKDISKLIIGYNKQWKQDINIGKRNNQNFVNIPFYKFISMLEYKCELEGVEMITHEESYTSKCSFLDNEPIKKHDSYLGKRIKRGLFRSSKGELINADLNGSYNIMRKVVPNFTNGIEGVVVHPRLITV